MARSRINVNVDASGPLFDGRAEKAVDDWLSASQRDVADMGLRELDAVVMDRSGRGTGYFQDHIAIHRFKTYGDALVISPDYPAVLYGPWLEGTSSRNDHTRFKGYHLFRKTRLRLRRVFKDVMDARFREYAKRMGGGTL